MYRYPELTTQSYMPSVATDLGLAWLDDADFHNTYPDLTDGAGLAEDDLVNPNGSSNLPLDFTVHNALPDINSMSSGAISTWPRFERDIGTCGGLRSDDDLPTLPPEETFDFRTDVRLRMRGPQLTDHHHNLCGSMRVTPSRGVSLMGQSIDGDFDAPISPVEYSEAGFTAHAWSLQPPHTTQPLGSDYSAEPFQQSGFPSTLTLTSTPISADGRSFLSRVKQTRAAFLVPQRERIEMTDSRPSGSQESRSWNRHPLSQARIEQRQKQGRKAKGIIDQAFRDREYTNGIDGPGRLFIKGRLIKLVEAFELAVTQPLAGRASSSFNKSQDKKTKRHNFARSVMRLVDSLDPAEEYMMRPVFSLKRIEELERKQQELGL
jgi:hypothetical protein